MEDTLRVIRPKNQVSRNNVLILVLMEDTLRVRGYVSQDDGTFVLILVLMEDTLRATIDVGVTHSKQS